MIIILMIRVIMVINENIIIVSHHNNEIIPAVNPNIIKSYKIMKINRIIKLSNY